LSQAPQRSVDSEVAATTADHSYRNRPNQSGPSGDDAALSRRRNVGLGTFFNAILMTPPRRQNDDLRHVMAAWDCLALGGTLVAVISPGWERPANETDVRPFRRWFAAVQAPQEELPKDTFIESAPPMQSRLISAVREPLAH
jgi:hypothetical protein